MTTNENIASLPLADQIRLLGCSVESLTKSLPESSVQMVEESIELIGHALAMLGGVAPQDVKQCLNRARFIARKSL